MTSDNVQANAAQLQMLQAMLQPWHDAVADPNKAQQEVLHRFLQVYAQTDYGKQHSGSQIETIKDYWRASNVGIHIQPLENRANNYFTYKGLNPEGWQPYLHCKRLFTQAYILYNGDMVLCCADWERTTILGNVKEKSVEEVWNGKEATAIRKKFLSGDTKDLLCHSCMRQPRRSM